MSLGLASALLLAVGIAPAAAGGRPSPARTAMTAQSSTTRSVALVHAPKNVTQGDRFAVTVKVSSAQQAMTVQIQTRTVDIFGNTSWSPVKTRKVRGTAKHTFKLLATGVDTQRFRARAKYRSGQPAISQSFGITVWQWTDLREVSYYYVTNGAYAGQFSMNGDQYIGWFTSGPYSMWETRYTTGRNCKAFRGVFGVTDSSADGSSAQFTLLTDESTEVYASPVLVPGTVERVQFAVAKPYRFSIQARNTSPDGLRSFPAIGTPQLLCNTEF